LSSTAGSGVAGAADACISFASSAMRVIRKQYGYSLSSSPRFYV
jgi:hypothetical protein